MASRAVYVGKELLPSVAAARRRFGWNEDETREIRRRLCDGFAVQDGVRIVYAVPGRKLRQRGRAKVGVYVDEDTRAAIVEGARCANCGSKGPLEVDHVVPIAEGGSLGRENLQPLCVPCHREKSAAECPAGASPPQPIEIPGFGKFPSLHAASKATGFNRSTIRRRRDEGTLDGLKSARESLAGVSLMRPLYVGGEIYPSRGHATTALDVRDATLRTRLEDANSAWCLRTYRETWRWEKLERKTLDGGADCDACGAEAKRIVHAEVWLDLRRSPFRRPVVPVCQGCHWKISQERRPAITKAELAAALECLAIHPKVPPEVLAEQRRRIKNPPKPQRFRYPVFVNGNLFACTGEAERFFGAPTGTIGNSLRKSGIWRGVPVRKATQDELPPGSPTIQRYRRHSPGRKAKVPPEVLAEQRRLISTRGRRRAAARPIFIDGNLFASFDEAERFFGGQGISRAVADNAEHWHGFTFRPAEQEELPSGAPPITKRARRQPNRENA